MDLMEVRRRLLMASKKRLPKEYQKVAYIESTGTQWIDTGILANDGIKIECRMGWVNANPNNQQLFGARSGAGDYRFYVTSYGGIDFAHRTDIRISSNINARQLFDLVYDTTLYDDTATGYQFQYSLDGDERTARTQPLSTNLTIYLFGTNRISYTTNKYLYPVIYESMVITNARGKELFNGIPCYRKSDGEIGIYDLVTDTFLTNQGTGSFLKGADV